MGCAEEALLETMTKKRHHSHSTFWVTYECITAGVMLVAVILVRAEGIPAQSCYLQLSCVVEFFRPDLPT